MQTLERKEVETLAAPSEVVSKADYEGLVKRLKKIEGRLRVQEAVRLLPYGLLTGGVVGLLVALYSRVTPSFTLEQVALVAIPAVVLGVVAVLLYAFLRPRPLLNTARRVDLALSLKERLSTAVEGHLNPERLGYAAMGIKQFDDARRSVDGLKYSKALPLKVPRREGLAAIALIPLLALALLLPNPFSDQVKDNQAVKSQIEEQAQKIEELKQRIEKENPEAAKNDPKTQELLKQLEQVKKDLLEKSNNKDDALAALEKAREELEKLGDANKSTAEKAALESLAKTFNSTDATKPAGQALQNDSAERFENAAKELEKLATPENLDKLKKDPAQAQQLSEKLAKDAESFKNTNPEMAKKLQELSNATNSNNLKQDSQQAQQALKDVAQELRQSGQNQQTNQQLQEAQSQLQKSEESINRASQQGSSSANQRRQADANADPTNGDRSSGDPSGNQSSDANGQQGQQSQNGQQGQQSQNGQQGQQGQGQQGQGQQGQNGQNGQQGQGQQGQNGQQGQGQGQQGQNGQQGQGQGQGQGQQPGQGQGEGQGDGQGDQPGQGSRAGKGTSDNVYANPTLRRDKGSQTNVQGKDGQGPTNNQTVNGGNPSGEANVPYSQVLDEYQQQAAQQLDKNYIPLTLKDAVKQYFEDLNKRENK